LIIVIPWRVGYDHRHHWVVIIMNEIGWVLLIDIIKM
jgi:hypothetical protein